MPMVIRIPFGGGIGAVEHHAESPESFFCHIAGLRVVACSNPQDAYDMLRAAIACDDPVIFFEPKRRYWEKGDAGHRPHPRRRGELAAAVLHQCRPPGRHRRHRGLLRPEHAGPVRRGRRRRRPRAARWRSSTCARLSPLDLGPVVESVRRTGRLVVVSEAPRESSITADIAARVTEEAFYSLAAPVLRVAGFDTPYPPSRLEDEYLPDLDKVLRRRRPRAGLLTRVEEHVTSDSVTSAMNGRSAADVLDARRR